MKVLTGKQRMLNAYRGVFSDRVAIAPEFWYYYPAKLLGVDMIEFQREVPFHQALKTTFAKFSCEGWCNGGGSVPNLDVTVRREETWVDADTLEVRWIHKTPHGELACADRFNRHEPSWCVERLVKDLERDLPAFEDVVFGGDVEQTDFSGMVRAWTEVGDAYLYEASAASTFFDMYGWGRHGGFEATVMDFMNEDLEPTLRRMHERHIERSVRMTRAICEKTPLESLFIGCGWSCNSLEGPTLWRRWDKPVIRAVAEEAHRHGRVLHLHFHGASMETSADFAEIGVDCVCPFERPPGGDVAGAAGLVELARQLAGRTTMNGNVHTVETLIRGTPADVRREVGEILEAFAGNPRVIVGTGDQVGRETPEENLHAMIDEAKRISRG